MEGTKVKPGQTVTLEGFGEWEVLDRHPMPAHWWLHRWEGQEWHVTSAHARQLALLGDSYRLKRAVSA